MLTLARTSVMNFENAMRGARNPLNSWDRMDSHVESDGTFVFGPNDLNLARRLTHAGSDHRKFIRQIFVSVDITAPIYWWKEYDTYKVGTVANSTSTMHKIQSKRFSRSDFSLDHMRPEMLELFDQVIAGLETARKNFLATKDKGWWYTMIQMLPESYNQTRTCTMNYENLVNQYHSRCNHKLEEWHTYCDWASKLPYFKELFLDPFPEPESKQPS
ncbi:MAG: hypothetical protein SPF89_11960 [Sphaerochaetaceae bacterium]|nr:hypothetical protein [Spirochaetales bacterium]MDY5500808.1 hypothetical protein [Sphaerochaetaceae bacterium]